MTKLGLSYTAKPSRGRAAEESLAHGGEVMQLGAPFHGVLLLSSRKLSRRKPRTAGR